MTAPKIAESAREVFESEQAAKEWLESPLERRMTQTEEGRQVVWNDLGSTHFGSPRFPDWQSVLGYFNELEKA